VLKQPEYFGQYGNILKIVVNTVNAYKSTDSKAINHSAYITYSKSSEASIAILAVDGMMINNNCLRATYGSTRFCAFYIKGKECNNKECLYLHTEPNDYDEILEKDEINKKINFKQQQLQAIKIADIFNFEIRKKIMTSKVVVNNAVLPGIISIYENPVVYDNDLNYYEFEEYLNKENNSIKDQKSPTKVDKSDSLNTSNARKESKERKNSMESKGSRENKNINNPFQMFPLSNSHEELQKHKENISFKPCLKEDENLSYDDCTLMKSSSEEITSEIFACKMQKRSINSISTTESNEKEKDMKDICVKLYKPKENSRFNFIEESSNNDIEVVIPKFVKQIIINKMLKPKDKLRTLLEQNVIQNLSCDSKANSAENDWANFLLENLNDSGKSNL